MSRDQTAPGEGAFNLYTFGGRDRTVGKLVRPQTRIFWEYQGMSGTPNAEIRRTSWDV
jgi:hypothetical protein